MPAEQPKIDAAERPSSKERLVRVKAALGQEVRSKEIVFDVLHDLVCRIEVLESRDIRRVVKIEG